MPRIPLPPQLRDVPFTSARGLAAGLSYDRMLNVELHRPFHGVRSLAPVDDTRARAFAFQQRMPSEAFFCSLTAAIIMGVPLPPLPTRGSSLHVAMPSPRRALAAKGIVGHKLQLLGGQHRVWDGLRVSGPELLWCELGTLLSVPDLVAAGDYLIHHELPMTTLPRLRDAVAQHPGRRGKPALREALELLNDRAESPQESRLRVHLVQAGVGELAINLPITTSGGFRYRADIAIPDAKVIIEYQGDHHRERQQYRSDMTRNSRLEADGWFIILVNADDLQNPNELVHRIHSVLARRRAPERTHTLA